MLLQPVKGQQVILISVFFTNIIKLKKIILFENNGFDLEQRIINDSELNAPDFSALYTLDANGYPDYPVLFN